MVPLVSAMAYLLDSPADDDCVYGSVAWFGIHGPDVRHGEADSTVKRVARDKVEHLRFRLKGVGRLTGRSMFWDVHDELPRPIQQLRECH